MVARLSSSSWQSEIRDVCLYLLSIANCRGSWVVGESRGSWVWVNSWVWVKVVGSKKHLNTAGFPGLESRSLCVVCGHELVRL